MVKVPKIHDDTLSSLLDRIGILREELVSIERSLERMKDAESKKAKGPFLVSFAPSSEKLRMTKPALWAGWYSRSVARGACASPNGLICSPSARLARGGSV